ncbi:MAG: ATP-binding cassette, subfamily multidrug efflux pump [Chloroflexota bacterium]|nr:ATP-binding cassette, subfamily multidrug efflux pump [Chloroflexota bacterium]
MKNLLKLFKYLKPYWKEAVLALILLVLVVVMDLAIPRLVQQIIDKGITPGNLDEVKRTALLMLGISLLNTVFAIGNNVASVNASEAASRDLREDLFKKIQEFSYSNLDQLKTGNLIVRLTSDITMLQQTFRMSMRISVRAPLLIFGSLALMFSTNAALTLKIIPLMLLTAVVVVYFIYKLGPLFLTVQKKLDSLNTVLQENVAGVRVVKAFVRRLHEEQRFEGVNEDYALMNILIQRFFSTFSPLLTLIINAAIVIVVWSGGLQVIGGSLSIGQIVAFVDYLNTAMAPLLIMVMLANAVASGIASADRVTEIFDTQPEIIDSAQALALGPAVQGRVEFQHVGFYYDGAVDECVLEDINLVAEPGQTVAILGATGSGKSTLVNLIPRFYDVKEGRILIDGSDVRDLQQDALLAAIAITPQDTILFSGTVSQNIAYGRPDATQEEIVQAAKAAQVHEFINDLPEGYETLVAQRGVNLSGGQKQRIAIARAILCRPKILILDDSTSAVDVETESKIQDALDQLIRGCTSFVVAQRISTVLDADQIVVLDKGRLVAQGTHAELIRNSPVYKEIFDSQLGDGNRTLQELLGNRKMKGAAANG